MTEILTSIRRTPYQSFAAFLVLFFTLFLATIFFIFLSFLYGLLGYVETRPQVTVYFETKTPENDIFKIRNELISSEKVDSIKYVSKNDAFKIYKELNKDNPLLLEMVSADILPASLEIYAKKPTYMNEIADFLKNKPGVDEVNFQKDIVEKLLSLTNILRKITVIFFIFLILMSTVVLMTTTLFKIALKKDEIEVLRLLGATSFYIRKPFLFEGIFFGLLASVFSFLIVAAGLLYLYPFFTSYLRGIQELTLSIATLQFTVWPVSLYFLLLTLAFTSLFGITIALIASYLATEKYLT